MIKRLKCLVYGLTDPSTGKVRYIGKSMSGMRRPTEHCMPHEVRGDLNYHKTRWIRRLLSLGSRPNIVIFDALEDSAGLSELEQYRIAYGRSAGWPLTNLTAGGGGNIGLRRTAESRAKMSSLMSGKKRGPLSPEHRAKLSAANRNRVLSLEAREKMLAPLRPNWGKRPSDATRAKMSASAKRRDRNYSAETREKLATRRGKKISPETKTKMSEARLRYWSTHPRDALKHDASSGRFIRGVEGD